MTTIPLSDEQHAARIAEVIRPRMLIGLQNAELYDEPGTERINEWADSISRWAAEALRPELDRLRAELAREQHLHGETIADRDRAQDMADKLAAMIASEDEIGEHTGMNDPWQNALDLYRELVPEGDGTLADEIRRLRSELATARAQICDCFAATFHARTCQHAVTTWNGTAYNTGHWLIDRDGAPWMPHSLADGMTGELLLLCNGDYSNAPVPISDVLDAWGPLTVGGPVDHSTGLDAGRES